MNKLEITSPDIKGKAYIEILDISGWWASERSSDPKYKITDARLEETVYFVLKSEGMRNHTEIELQLYDLEEMFFLDYLYPDKCKFDGEKKSARTTMKNGVAFVELELPRKWTKDVKDNYGKKELYWRVKCSYFQEKHLPEKKSDYLNVRYSDRNLYVQPSLINSQFPEFYDSDGSQFVVGMASKVSWETGGGAQQKDEDGVGSAGVSEMSGIADDKVLKPLVKQEIRNLVLIKLSNGYMVDSSGRIFANVPSEGALNNMYFKEIYTEEGIRVGHFHGPNIDMLDGATTEGIDQYRFFAKHGLKAKTLGFIKNVGGIWDVFSLIDIMNFGLKDEKETLPIPLPGADIIGMMATAKAQDFEEAWEQHRASELEKAKRKGLAEVKKWVRSPMAEEKYDIWEISSNTARNALLGKFKTFDELYNYDTSTYDEKNIIILLRYELDPITGKRISIIETFFRT